MGSPAFLPVCLQPAVFPGNDQLLLFAALALACFDPPRNARGTAAELAESVQSHRLACRVGVSPPLRSSHLLGVRGGGLPVAAGSRPTRKNRPISVRHTCAPLVVAGSPNAKCLLGYGACDSMDGMEASG